MPGPNTTLSLASGYSRLMLFFRHRRYLPLLAERRRAFSRLPLPTTPFWRHAGCSRADAVRCLTVCARTRCHGFSPRAAQGRITYQRAMPAPGKHTCRAAAPTYNMARPLGLKRLVAPHPGLTRCWYVKRTFLTRNT